MTQIEQGEGAGPVEIAFKREMMQETLALLNGLIDRSQTVWQSQVSDLRDRIEAEFPYGYRRVWVHATRRRLPDRDLCLTERALDALQAKPFPDIYWIACIYCAWQSDLRLRFTPGSAARIHHVADFWQREWRIRET